MRGLILLLVVACFLTPSCFGKKKNSAAWFRADTESDCISRSDQVFRQDHPKVLCENLNQTICVCARKKQTSKLKYLCGDCEYFLKLSVFQNGTKMAGLEVGGENMNNTDSPVIPPGLWINRRWPEGIIPYEIDDEANDLRIFAVKLSMAKISKVSCVKFVPYEEDIHSQFVRFQTSADGCWTKTVGRPTNGPSVVNIGDGCGSGKKILHEVLHSVGMFHTHQRHDRDDYIVVNTTNITPGNAAGFKQLTKTQFPDLGVAYDCRSIMHYPKKFFSVNQENTIDAKDGGNCTTVGPENAKMTENDILWLNLFYQCPTAV